MTISEYAAALKKGLSGGYLFYGEERYLVARYLEMTRQALLGDADLSTFNHIRLHGDDFSPERLLQAMEALPVFAEKKLIEISGIDLDRMSEGGKEQLLQVLSLLPDYEYNIVLLIAAPDQLDPGTPKKPSATVKALGEVLSPVLFERQTQAKLNKWLGQHFAAWGLLAPMQVCTFLIEYAGSDMTTLASQAEKLACYLLANEKTELTVDDVRTVACSVTDYDTYALGDAILSGSVDRALAVLLDRKRRRERPEIILGGISGVFQILLRIKTLQNSGMTLKDISAKTGLHAYRVELYARGIGRRSEDSLRRALTLCYETDLAIKASSLDPFVMIERLIAEVTLC